MVQTYHCVKFHFHSSNNHGCCLPCNYTDQSFVGGCQHIAGMCHLHLHGRRQMQQIPMNICQWQGSPSKWQPDLGRSIFILPTFQFPSVAQFATWLFITSCVDQSVFPVMYFVRYSHDKGHNIDITHKTLISCLLFCPLHTADLNHIKLSSNQYKYYEHKL